MNERQIFNEIERAALKDHPSVTHEQAVSRYLSDNPRAYDRYVAAESQNPDDIYEEIMELARERYPDDEDDRAFRRYIATKRGKALYRMWLAAGGVEATEPDVPEAEREFFDAARRAYPDLDEPQACYRFSQTREGSRLLSAALT